MICSHSLPFSLSILLFVCGSLIRADPQLIDPTRVIQLSWRPRAFLYKGFLSDEECDHLIVLAKDNLEKSMVADNESGKSIMSEVRTSSGMFLERRQDEIVARIERKIEAWTFLPEEYGEQMQILHYENGEKYEPHYDYFHDQANQALGGHRIATVLMYLSNVIKGGETIFPESEDKVAQEKDETWSDCAKNGYAVKPAKGDALLFFNLHPDATTDSDSLHGSCPVIEGEKWSATKWIHVRSFEEPVKLILGDECADKNELCSKWAAAGECDRNPPYMMKYYIVFMGRRPGIYKTWEECHYNVVGYSGALYRAVKSEEEAIQLFKANLCPTKSSKQESSINTYHPSPLPNKNTNVWMIIVVIAGLFLVMLFHKYLFG